jgi:Cof subfamily protein (haloacid dehalogenase superfamily)
MNSYRLLVADIDGTLITSQRQIPLAVKAAVAAAQARDVLVCLATGRIWPSAEPFVLGLGSDPPAILANGGIVYDFRADKVLRQVPLAYEHARGVLELLGSFPGVQPHLYAHNRVYVGRVNVHSELYRRKDKLVIEEVGDLLAFLPADPTKILIIGERHDLVEAAAAIAHLPFPINMVFSEHTYLEVLPTGSSKGAALEFVARLLGVPANAIVAVGDNLNDQEMLRFAGLGVAMGNAPPELQAQADYVTKTNDEEGLVEVIERFILNGVEG